jgi:hypothetical protein
VVTGVSVVYIHSANKAKLTKWYQETLGLKASWDAPDWTSFQFANGVKFAIDQQVHPVSLLQKQPIMINFEVKNLKKAIEDLSKKDVKFYPSKADTIVDVGTALVATFIDPDGNFVNISQQK